MPYFWSLCLLMFVLAGCGNSQSEKLSSENQFAAQKELKVQRSESQLDAMLARLRRWDSKQTELMAMDSRVRMTDEDSFSRYTEEKPLVASLQSLSLDLNELANKIAQGGSSLQNYYQSTDLVSYYPDSDDISFINEIGKDIKILQTSMNRYKMALRSKNTTNALEDFDFKNSAHSIISCESLANGTSVLHIKAQWHQNADDERYSKWLKLGLKNFWNNDKLIFQLDKAEGIGIQFKKIKGQVSYTKDDSSNEILVGEDGQYSNSYYAKILAHEFGHILGLKDCYYQFYDSQSDTLVYYEKDTNNLMCSLRNGASIPALYEEKIRMSFCH